MSDDDYAADVEGELERLRKEVQQLRRDNSELKRKLGDADSAPAPSKQPKQPKKAAPAQNAKKLAQQLFAAVSKKIKKQGHHSSNKPWAEEVSVMWPQEVWEELLGDAPSSSKGKALIKKVITPHYAVTRLGWSPTVSPVKFSGKIWMAIGEPSPKIHAFAGYETIEFRYKPASNLCSVKVRTSICGYGEQRAAEINEAMLAQYASQAQ